LIKSKKVLQQELLRRNHGGQHLV